MVWEVRITQNHRQCLHSIFDYNRNYASILYHFRVVASYLSKVSDFNLPHIHLAPRSGVTLFEFEGDLLCQKTRVPGLSYDVACVIQCLAILIQYWHVTDRQLDSPTDRRTHDDS